MTEGTQIAVLDGLSTALGDLVDRQVELLECLREIRRARDLRDLGIVTPAQWERTGLLAEPPTAPTPPIPAGASADVPVSSGLASMARAAELHMPEREVGLPPPTLKRSYDYFTELDMKRATLASAPDSSVRD